MVYENVVFQLASSAVNAMLLLAASGPQTCQTLSPYNLPSFQVLFNNKYIQNSFSNLFCDNPAQISWSIYKTAQRSRHYKTAQRSRHVVLVWSVMADICILWVILMLGLVQLFLHEMSKIPKFQLIDVDLFKGAKWVVENLLSTWQRYKTGQSYLTCC